MTDIRPTLWDQIPATYTLARRLYPFLPPETPALTAFWAHQAPAENAAWVLQWVSRLYTTLIPALHTPLDQLPDGITPRIVIRSADHPIAMNDPDPRAVYSMWVDTMHGVRLEIEMGRKTFEGFRTTMLQTLGDEIVERKRDRLARERRRA